MPKLCMVLLAVLCWPLALRAQEATVSMDFQGVELPVFLQWILRYSPDTTVTL